MNKVEICGRIANEVKVNKTKTGKSVTNITIAAEDNKHTEFIRCQAWEDVADNIGKHKKGDELHIKGHIHNSSYEANGEKRYSTDVVIDSVE